MSRGIIDNEKPSIGGRRHLCPKNCIAGTLIFVAFSSITIFIVFWCTNIFRDAILSSLEIKNGSTMFDWWQRPSVRPLYKITIFNYTNVDDFERGKTKKLKVQEVGPYVYRETFVRMNPKFNDDGTVSYQEHRSFQREGGSPDDEMVTVPNIPLITTITLAKDLFLFARVGLTAFLTAMKSKNFINVTAGGYLWGYNDQIYNIAKPYIAWKENITFQNFGILAFKNGLSKDRVTINTGRDDINELGLTERVNGMESRKVWGDDKCDKIEGTDGTLFPPNLIQDANSTLKVYARDMCRTLTLKYHGRGNVHGIPTLTYKPPLDELTSSATKDSCYCAETSPGSMDSERTCPPAGIFNISACTFKMPFLVSYPHFYGADREFIEKIDGLDPRAELHDSVIEIHPRLGVPIGGYSRLQMNIEVRKTKGLPFFDNLEDGSILPLVWIEVAVDKMPDSILNLLHHAYFTAGAVEAGMQWASLVGIVFSVCSVIFMLK